MGKYTCKSNFNVNANENANVNVIVHAHAIVHANAYVTQCHLDVCECRVMKLYMF